MSDKKKIKKETKKNDIIESDESSDEEGSQNESENEDKDEVIKPKKGYSKTENEVIDESEHEESDDNHHSEEVEYDDDAEDEGDVTDDEHANEQLVNLLILANQLRNKRKREDENKFIPSLKLFLKGSIQDREMKINNKIVKKFDTLAGYIKNRKIDIMLPRYERRDVNSYLKAHPDDKKVMLVEYHPLKTIFDKVIRHVERNT